MQDILIPSPTNKLLTKNSNSDKFFEALYYGDFFVISQKERPVCIAFRFVKKPTYYVLFFKYKEANSLGPTHFA